MPRNQLDRSVYERASRLRPQVRDRYVHGRLLGVRWIAGGGGAICRVTTSTGGQIDVLFDSATRSLTELTSASENAYELIPSIQERSWSPSFAGTRLRSIDGDLYLDAAAGGSLRRLTHDGSSFNRYGACFVPHRADDPEVPAVGVWSRDGRYVLSQRLDYRGVRAIPYTEAAPSDGGAPILHTKIDAFPGDQHIVHAHPVVVDTQLGACRTVEMPSLPCTHSSPLLRGDCWWDELSASFFCLRSTRDWRTLQLWQIDPKTGAAQKLMEEASDRRLRPSQYFHQRPNVRVLHDQNGEVDRVVWFSERNGWGHLFLVDLNSGSWSRAITGGDWTVQEILRVDEQSGHIWLLASGLVASDPYRWTVLRVTIESGAVQRLTPDELDHRALVSRDDATNFFVDTASSANRPPVVRFLDWDGNELGCLPEMNLEPLRALGWRPPERFSAIATDGKMEIYGTIYFPPDFDPSCSYPIIDHLYPGPQVNRSQPFFDADEIEPMAALGLIGVTIDGRGTPGRSRIFHEHVYRNLGGASGIEDHVAAIHQLAETRPWMDTSRVAVVGHSAGGFATTRAMELFPDFYSVGVSQCGRHDGRLVFAMVLEAYDDPEDPESWLRASAIEEAGKITGKLLLIHGETDRDITLHNTMRLIDKLIEANRDFDLLVVPGDDHVFSRRRHYVERRTWDHLVRHLLDLEPPAGFEIHEHAD